MTALSAMLLAAAHRRRPLPGAFWRAGLVCAALKSVSPSAVLLGPMVAIAAEGFLMEAGAALLPGRAGLALGGGLAMAWIPVHLAGRALLLYGWDAALLFDAAWEKAASRLGLLIDPWSLLGLVWLLHFLAGAAAASVSWRGVGRVPLAPATASPSRPPSLSISPPRLGMLSEMFWLDLLLLILSLRLLKTLPLTGAFAWAAGLAAAWAWLYPGAARRLARPGLWLGVSLVALAAGALLGEGGTEAGARMALRALLLSAGFAALSQELAGPAMRARLARWGAGPLLTAVEGAFASLPTVLARLPAPGEGLRHPGAALEALLDAAEPPSVHLVTGVSGSGKSRFVSEVVSGLKQRGVKVKGVLAPGRWSEGVRQGFDLVDIGTGEGRELSRRDGPPQWPRLAGPFHFSEEAIAQGRKALSEAADADLVVVDEVGPLELEGGGWAAELDRLTASGKTMLWVVRQPLLETVQARWGVFAERVWTPSDAPAAAAEALAGPRL